MPESGGAGQKVLVREEQGKRSRVTPAQPDAAWAWLGWLGLVLAIAGLVDLGLLLIPFEAGSPEWEFATVVSITSGLPLVSIGFAALVASAAARGVGWMLWVNGIVLALGTVVVLLLLLLFLTNVPVAMRATSGAAETGIVKAIAKTVLLSGLFGAAYAAAAIWSIRLAMGKGDTA